MTGGCWLRWSQLPPVAKSEGDWCGGCEGCCGRVAGNLGGCAGGRAGGREGALWIVPTIGVAGGAPTGTRGA